MENSTGCSVPVNRVNVLICIAIIPEFEALVRPIRLTAEFTAIVCINYTAAGGFFPGKKLRILFSGRPAADGTSIAQKWAEEVDSESTSKTEKYAILSRKPGIRDAAGSDRILCIPKVLAR